MKVIGDEVGRIRGMRKRFPLVLFKQGLNGSSLVRCSFVENKKTVILMALFFLLQSWTQVLLKKSFLLPLQMVRWQLRAARKKKILNLILTSSESNELHDFGKWHSSYLDISGKIRWRDGQPECHELIPFGELCSVSTRNFSSLTLLWSRSGVWRFASLVCVLRQPGANFLTWSFV